MIYQVYRNLNNGKISIMNVKTRLVVGHADTVMLDNAEFIVNQKGRERVVAEGKKNVHAFIRGHITQLKNFTAYKNREVELTLPFPADLGDVEGVKYNPFKAPTFVLKDTGEPIYKADMVGVSSNGKMAAFI